MSEASAQDGYFKGKVAVVTGGASGVGRCIVMQLAQLGAKVVLTQDNKILWNGNEITDSQLLDNLKLSLTLPVEPELQFEPEENAAYDLSVKVLNVIKGSQVTKFGFVGNEKYASF